MYGCLSVGVHAARAIAAACRKPLVGVHHMVSQVPYMDGTTNLTGTRLAQASTCPYTVTNGSGAAKISSSQPVNFWRTYDAGLDDRDQTTPLPL